jgi:CBS domain-containing protein
MRAAEIMSEGVEKVPSTMAADAAWEMMRRKGIHHLVVMNGSDVVGVLSHRDAGGRNGASIRARSTVGDLMTSSVVTVKPEETVRRIANLMRGRTIGCVPVVDKQRVVGIVTVSDLLDLVGGGAGRPSRAKRAALHHRVAHRHQRGSYGVW